MIPVLKEGIRNIDIKKIFDNRTRKIEYLERLFSKTDSNFEIPRSVTGLDNCIIDTWDYNLSKDILREMFFCSKKFLSGLDCKKEVDFLINDWYDNNLGEIEWPFSAMIFDSYVARETLNKSNSPRSNAHTHAAGFAQNQIVIRFALISVSEEVPLRPHAFTICIPG